MYESPFIVFINLLTSELMRAPDMAERPLQNWHPETVKYAIRRTGKAIRDVAIGASLDPSSLSHGLHRPIPKANQAIADYLGKTVNEIWPEWFDENGEQRSADPNTITRPGRDHGQKRAAI